MKLSYEQIVSVTVGALFTEEKEDGIHFYRCTEKQTAAWLSQREGLGRRSLATAGVRLDFETDSATLSFSVATQGKYELLINGLLREQFCAPEGGGNFSYRLSDPAGKDLRGEKRVTLCLPSHSVGILSSLEVEDGANLRRHNFDYKFLFLGDSITQGWDSRFDSLSYAYRTSLFFNAESVIQGIGGSYYWAEAFHQLAFSPDLVLVAYGANDFMCFRTLEEAQKQASACLDKAKEFYPQSKLVAISPIWRDKREDTALGSLADYCKMLIEEIEKRDIHHIHGLSLVPPMSDFFADEYLHPNDLGFSLYAENLVKQLQKFL